MKGSYGGGGGGRNSSPYGGEFCLNQVRGVRIFSLLANLSFSQVAMGVAQEAVEVMAEALVVDDIKSFFKGL